MKERENPLVLPINILSTATATPENKNFLNEQLSLKLKLYSSFLYFNQKESKQMRSTDQVFFNNRSLRYVKNDQNFKIRFFF